MADLLHYDAARIENLRELKIIQQESHAMIDPQTAYIALVSKDLNATRSYFGNHLGLPHARIPFPGANKAVDVFSIGETPLAVFEIGEPFLGNPARAGLHHVALATDDVAKALARAQAAGVRSDAVTAGLMNSPHAFLEPVGGIRLALTEPLQLAKHVPTPLVERMDHIGVASLDNTLITEILVQRLGLPLESYDTNTETIVTIETFASSKHGMGTHTRRTEVVGCNLCTFITIGDCELECIVGLDPVEAGSTQQAAAQGPKPSASASVQQNRGPGFHRGVLGKFITQYGPGLHHLAIMTANIDETFETLSAKGVVIMNKSGRPGARRSKIGFVHLDSTGGILMHFAERLS